MTKDEQIVEAITRDGPMTSAEIGEALGIKHTYARALVGKSKRLVIVEWRRDYSGGGRYYTRPVYGVRTSPFNRDVKRPPRQTTAESCRRHRERLKNAVSSVFQLGTPIVKRRVAVHVY